jgi:hypothetical protein
MERNLCRVSSLFSMVKKIQLHLENVMDKIQQQLISKNFNKYRPLSVQKKAQIHMANIERFLSSEKMVIELTITITSPNSSQHHSKAKK